MSKSASPIRFWTSSSFALLLGGFVTCQEGSLNAQIFVVNHGNGTIGKYSLSGETLNASFISGLVSPTGIAATADYLYVAQQNGKILKYTTDGALVNGSLITGLIFPLGVAVSDGFLYVANGGNPNSTIGKYTIDGTPVNPALISGPDNPTGLVVSGKDLYVTEWTDGVIGKYTTDGATVNSPFIPEHPEFGKLTYPGGLALDGAGYLYVSTIYDGVRKYTTSGVLVDPQLIANDYNSGLGLAYAGNGRLLLANNFGGGGFIREFTTSGDLVNANFITGLHNPVGIAVIPEPAESFALLGVGCLFWRWVCQRKNS